MNGPERDDVARRLAASEPAPERPASYFEGLGMLAAGSVPSAPPRGVHGRRLVSVAALVTGATVLLSSAAYAGALGETACDSVRRVLGDDKAAHQHVDHTPTPTEKIAPVVVLPRKDVAFVDEQAPGGVDTHADEPPALRGLQPDGHGPTPEAAVPDSGQPESDDGPGTTESGDASEDPTSSPDDQGEDPSATPDDHGDGPRGEPSDGTGNSPSDEYYGDGSIEPGDGSTGPGGSDDSGDDPQADSAGPEEGSSEPGSP